MYIIIIIYSLFFVEQKNGKLNIRWTAQTLNAMVTVDEVVTTSYEALLNMLYRGGGVLGREVGEVLSLPGKIFRIYAPATWAMIP